MPQTCLAKYNSGNDFNEHRLLHTYVCNITFRMKDSTQVYMYVKIYYAYILVRKCFTIQIFYYLRDKHTTCINYFLPQLLWEYFECFMAKILNLGIYVYNGGTKYLVDIPNLKMENKSVIGWNNYNFLTKCRTYQTSAVYSPSAWPHLKPNFEYYLATA